MSTTMAGQTRSRQSSCSLLTPPHKSRTSGPALSAAGGQQTPEATSWEATLSHAHNLVSYLGLQSPGETLHSEETKGPQVTEVDGELRKALCRREV